MFKIVETMEQRVLIFELLFSWINLNWTKQTNKFIIQWKKDYEEIIWISALEVNVKDLKGLMVDFDCFL